MPSGFSILLSLPPRSTVALRAYCDAFQPFSDSVFSLTAIFFSILNLPSSMRNDEDATMLVCVLSGPNEVASDHMHKITFYFKEELKELYRGMAMSVFVPTTGRIEQRVVHVRIGLILVPSRRHTHTYQRPTRHTHTHRVHSNSSFFQTRRSSSKGCLTCRRHKSFSLCRRFRTRPTVVQSANSHSSTAIAGQKSMMRAPAKNTRTMVKSG